MRKIILLSPVFFIKEHGLTLKVGFGSGINILSSENRRIREFEF